MKPSFALFFIIVEILIAIAYTFYTTTSVSATVQGQSFSAFYPLFTDVNAMVFVGFGFLMVFLRSHSWSAVGFNYLTAAVAIQTTPLFLGLWGNIFSTAPTNPISLDITTLLNAQFGAATVLITMGAILGKVSDSQLVFIAIFESFFYALNVQLGTNIFQVTDVGGSIFIHAFGGFFGIATSIAISNSKAATALNAKDGYWNNTLAFIGTIFLFIFWPSFNAATVAGTAVESLIVPNTFFSIIASAVTTFALSSLYNKGKLRAEDILNATLAGGVIIGAGAGLTNSIGTATFIGILGGIVSTVGFNRITPSLMEAGHLHDTCGVTNLHALPGFFGGIVSAILASNYAGGQGAALGIPVGRQASQQASYQFAFTLFTAAFAMISGYIGGVFLRSGFFQTLPLSRQFTDSEYWSISQKDYFQEDEEDNSAALQQVKQSVFVPATTVVQLPPQVQFSTSPVQTLTQSRRGGAPVGTVFQYNVQEQFGSTHSEI
jgi:ammonium transporter Rh